MGCPRPADWCDAPKITDDGPPDGCVPTAEDVEGPFYAADAPWRDDLTVFGDEGEVIAIYGQVAEGRCGQGVPGAVVEFWQADPEGRYDNRSDEMRYRCRVRCDEEGRYALLALRPGNYLNGRTYRPAHIHVKVVVDGIERLTTQLYFDDDPHLDCDSLANTSLAISLAPGDGAVTGGFDFLLAPS